MYYNNADAAFHQSCTHLGKTLWRCISHGNDNLLLTFLLIQNYCCPCRLHSSGCRNHLRGNSSPAFTISPCLQTAGSPFLVPTGHQLVSNVTSFALFASHEAEKRDLLLLSLLFLFVVLENDWLVLFSLALAKLVAPNGWIDNTMTTGAGGLMELVSHRYGVLLWKNACATACHFDISGHKAT